MRLFDRNLFQIHHVSKRSMLTLQTYLSKFEPMAMHSFPRLTPPPFFFLFSFSISVFVSFSSPVSPCLYLSSIFSFSFPSFFSLPTPPIILLRIQSFAIKVRISPIFPSLRMLFIYLIILFIFVIFTHFVSSSAAFNTLIALLFNFPDIYIYIYKYLYTCILSVSSYLPPPPPKLSPFSYPFHPLIHHHFSRDDTRAYSLFSRHQNDSPVIPFSAYRMR